MDHRRRRVADCKPNNSDTDRVGRPNDCGTVTQAYDPRAFRNSSPGSFGSSGLCAISCSDPCANDSRAKRAANVGNLHDCPKQKGDSMRGHRGRVRHEQ